MFTARFFGQLFGSPHGGNHRVDIGKDYYGSPRLDFFGEKLADAALDVGNDFAGFFARECVAELLEVVLQEDEGVFVDIKYLAVDICGITAFHCSVVLVD